MFEKMFENPQINLEQSVDQILEHGTAVTDRFYELFFEGYPEAKAKFDGVDMQTQSAMVTMVFAAIRQHPQMSLASQRYLQVLGTRHSRANVPRDLYQPFLETFLVTLKEFHGADWTDALAAQWRTAFEDIITLMLQGYEEHCHC